MPEVAVAPDVSVLVPVRDGGSYLPAALDSVLSQSGVTFEVICVDDGSSDGTWEVLTAYERKHPCVFRAVRAAGRGISRALNQAIGLARGRFLARMDADDISLPGRLALQARYLTEHQEVGVLGGQALLIDEAGRVRGRLRVPVGTHRVHAGLGTSSPLIHPTVMMRRDVVRTVGGYRPLFDGAEDYDLWLRLAPRTRLDNLSQPLLQYRRHARQQSRRRAFQQARLASLTVVAASLRATHGRDPVAGMEDLVGWRAALTGVDPTAVSRVRHLIVSRLADNGGTLTAAGAAYLQRTCRAAAGSPTEVRNRLALACVRHELQLMRNGRWIEALGAFARDIAQWRSQLLGAYVAHASILWRAEFEASRFGLFRRRFTSAPLGRKNLRPLARSGAQAGFHLVCGGAPGSGGKADRVGVPLKQEIE